MIKFIQKLIFLWEKKMHLTRMECEGVFIKSFFRDKLDINESELRGRLSKLRIIKNPTTKTKSEMMEIEQALNEAQNYKNMIAKGERSSVELRALIAIVRRSLWSDLWR